jgi:hypothetical protein
MGNDASAVPCLAVLLRCAVSAMPLSCAGEMAITGVGVMCLAVPAGVRLAADLLVMNSNDTLVPASDRFEIGASQ